MKTNARIYKQTRVYTNKRAYIPQTLVYTTRAYIQTHVHTHIICTHVAKVTLTPAPQLPYTLAHHLLEPLPRPCSREQLGGGVKVLALSNLPRRYAQATLDAIGLGRLFPKRLAEGFTTISEAADGISPGISPAMVIGAEDMLPEVKPAEDAIK